MKTEEIKELFEQFESIANEYEGIECWSARELCGLLGYSKWEKFYNVIEKARDACVNAGEHVDNNVAVRNMLLSRGIVPEQLPAGEDVKKVERRLKSEEKTLIKGKKK